MVILYTFPEPEQTPPDRLYPPRDGRRGGGGQGDRGRSRGAGRRDGQGRGGVLCELGAGWKGGGGRGRGPVSLGPGERVGRSGEFCRSRGSGGILD